MKPSKECVRPVATCLGAAFLALLPLRLSAQQASPTAPRAPEKPAHHAGAETRSPDDFELFLEGILEAPRGPRQAGQGTRYVSVFRSVPAACPPPARGLAEGVPPRDGFS
jgi:hypothetical protein